MRILIGECKQEVSTFNPAVSTTADFVFGRGSEILAFHDGLRSEIGGAMTVLQAGRRSVGTGVQRSGDDLQRHVDCRGTGIDISGTFLDEVRCGRAGRCGVLFDARSDVRRKRDRS